MTDSRERIAARERWLEGVASAQNDAVAPVLALRVLEIQHERPTAGAAHVRVLLQRCAVKGDRVGYTNRARPTRK
jgi:hypothetical protein